MSQTANTAIAVIGIDIGKNSFHVVDASERRKRARSGPTATGLKPFAITRSEEVLCNRGSQV